MAMNIVIASGIFPPDIGGPANFVPRIAHWLTQRGHQVQVVCWSDHLHHDDSHYSFTVHRILRHQSPVVRFYQTVNRLYQLGKSVDVLFANTLDLEVRLAATLARKSEVHKVVGDRAWEVARRRGWFTGTIDDYQKASQKASQKAYYPLVKSWRIHALNQLRNFSLARSHRIITPSQYLANIVRGWFNHPSNRSSAASCVDVIYNSTQLTPDTAPIEIPAYPGKTITTICRLVPWKGVDALVQALSQLPEVQLLIVGDGPERSALEQQAQQVQQTPGDSPSERPRQRIHFLGQVSKSQVRSVLNATDIFVLNSAYEGLPHVVLEAMAARVPVVATDVGGTGEVVKHNHTGLLIPAHDTAALTAALTQLLRSPESGKQLATNARSLIETQFSEAQSFMAYEQVLAELSGSPNIPLPTAQVSTR